MSSNDVEGTRVYGIEAPTSIIVDLGGDSNEGGAEPLVSLDDAIRAHIRRALSRTHGRIEGRGGAADLLGLNPHTLRGKMRKLRIDWASYRQKTGRTDA